MKSTVINGGAKGAAADAAYEGLGKSDLLAAYRCMVLSRRLDDKEIQLKHQSQIFFQISGAGHEAVQVAAGLVLKAGYDWFFPYYRDRALCLQLGVSPLDMLLAGVGAKDDPSSGGRQMPSHWGSPPLNIVSGSSPTGTQVLHSVGAAEAGVIYSRVAEIPDRESCFRADEVIFTALGDGSTSEGEFWEAMNSACTKHLPVLFLVEDNGYAISVPVEVQTPGGDISRLVRSFPGLHVDSIDGTDFFASLRANGLATQDELTTIAADVDREINDAALLALAARKPEKDTATQYLFSPDADPTSAAFVVPGRPEGEPDTMVTAINRTLKDEMARNPRIVVFGQDVADVSRREALPLVAGKGGVFKLTHGLQRLYGDDRVFNSPLAEANIIGRAIGMGVRKLKPVVEIQFFDYIWPAMMQIRDEMSMLRYRSNNAFSCPMVIRVAIGGYLRGGGPYHSQSGESIFAHCPGIRIAYPSTAVDAAGLLRTAIRCDDPVLFLEHKHLYRQTYNKGEYQGKDFMIPFASASLRREGSDVVVVTWGALVQRVLLAAHQAEKEGISTAVLDLRTIAPYDWDAIASHVRQTSRIVIAHEDQLTCGFGAELSARVASDLFAHLDAPVRRVGALDVPVAYNPELEDAILPQVPDVLHAIRETVRY